MRTVTLCLATSAAVKMYSLFRVRSKRGAPGGSAHVPNEW